MCSNDIAHLLFTQKPILAKEFEDHMSISAMKALGIATEADPCLVVEHLIALISIQNLPPIEWQEFLFKCYSFLNEVGASILAPLKQEKCIWLSDHKKLCKPEQLVFDFVGNEQVIPEYLYRGIHFIL